MKVDAAKLFKSIKALGKTRLGNWVHCGKKNPKLRSRRIVSSLMMDMQACKNYAGGPISNPRGTCRTKHRSCSFAPLSKRFQVASNMLLTTIVENMMTINHVRKT